MSGRKPEDPAGAQRRARDRAAGMKAWNLADDGRTYHVKSRSGAGFYTVRVAEDRESVMFCDCKGFSFRRNCKHAEAVRKRIRREGRRLLATKQAVKESETMMDRAKQGVWERFGWGDKKEE